MRRCQSARVVSRNSNEISAHSLFLPHCQGRSWSTEQLLQVGGVVHPLIPCADYIKSRLESATSSLELEVETSGPSGRPRPPPLLDTKK